MTALATPRRATVPGWVLVVLAGVAVALVRLQVSGSITTVMGAVVGPSFAFLMLVRASRSHGRPRRAWALFALSVLAGSASQVLYPWDGTDLAGLVREILDAAAYVFGVAGGVLFVRDFGGADPDAWLDAAAVGIALSLVVFEVVLGPAGEGGGVTGRPLAFLLAVAAIDAAAFTMLARFVIRPIATRTTAMLAGILALTLAFDAAYNTGSTPHVSRATYEAAWYVAYAAWAAGGLRPEIPKLQVRVPGLPHTIQQEVRSTLVAVLLHGVALASVPLLIWYSVATGDPAGVPVLLLGMLALVGNATARTARVVRRLAVDSERRLAAEAALRQSEERFRRLAEVAPVGIFVADADGRSVFQNEAWARANGISAPAGLDLGYMDTVHPADRESALARWFDSVRTRTPMSVDHRVLRPDGTVAWVHADAVPLEDAAGRPAGWVGTVSDVTKLVEARTSAEEREAFFNELIEQSPVGIGVYGPDGGTLGMNEATLGIRARAGAPAEVVDVRTDSFMVQLGQADAIARAYAGDPADANPGIVTLPPGGGTDGSDTPAHRELALRMRWYPMRGTDGRILAVISFTEDVTEGVRAEAEHRRVEAKLQESAKLEALGVLAGGVAHDFNNLLVAILGHVEFARNELPPGSPAVADLVAAETAALRAADLARQMLAYSGRGSLATGPVDLEVLLREMGDLVAHSIGKGARLRYEFTPGLPPVLADATQLRQLALNLIVNASDALGGHRGAITLRTGLVHLGTDDPGLVAGTTAAPGEYVQLEVTDTGHGMDAATLARIFDPFYSTKSVGRGLGLAATLGIVKGHGGAIRVLSSPGAGTTFQVLLRRTEVMAREPGPQAAPPHERLAGRVLLVDDEATVRQVARRILQRAGFQVVEAADGPEALELFMASPDAYDAVVLDLTLPTMDGKTVLRDLRARRPDLPVVLCSGWSADEVADGLGAMRRIMFLQKPFTARAMLDALVEVTRPTAEG